MTIILTRRWNDMEITFSFSPADSETGILFNPSIMDNPRFFETLQYARTAYPVMEALAATYNRYDVARPQYAEHDDFIELKRQIDMVLNWTKGDFTSSELEHVTNVDRIVSEELERRRIRDERRAAKKKRSVVAGYVYLLQSPSTAYKIGRSADPRDRLKTFNVHLPFEVEYICVIPTDDMYALEKELHARFADKRINGEWFELTADDVEYIKSLVVPS